MESRKIDLHRKGLRRLSPTPYLLLLPTLALFAVFTYYPFFKTIFLSFTITDKTGAFSKWVGLANWKRILSKSSFWDIVGTTLEFAGLNLVFTFAIAMFFALLSMNKARGAKIYQVLYAMPLAIASSPAAAIWLFLFRKDNGLLNFFLGTSFAWTRDASVALLATSIVTIWMHVGASFIFLLVGFRNVDDELIESAIIDGAGPLKRIFSVIIPIASPQIFFVLFLNITNSFKAFAQIKLLTGGGPSNATKTLIFSVYENAIINGRFETACVQSLVLFAVIFLATRIQFVLENRTVFYQ